MSQNSKVQSKAACNPKSTKKQSRQSANTDSEISDEDMNSTNAHYTKFSSSIFKGNPYLSKFIKSIPANVYSFECSKCSKKSGKKKVVLVNSLFIHLDSRGHRDNTPEAELNQLEDALKLLDPKSKKVEESKSEDKKVSRENESYLQFIGFLMSQHLSYAQIERIGRFLQKAASEKQLGFLQKANFDQRFLSKISQECFGKAFYNDLLEKLSERPYSLILDNSTFCGESLCAIKVKFLAQEWDEELKISTTKVNNKILSLTNLKESSSGKTLMEIVQNKLFRSDDVKKNLIGFVHDNGSSLVGDKLGLVTLLQKSGINFLDICDPCHGLNLSLKHSLKELSPLPLKFVSSISNHFSSSQKKACLRRIQEENGYKILYPKKLAQTRWLSLGQSLKRILDIWESLIKYFDSYVSQKAKDKNVSQSGKKKKKSEKYQEQRDKLSSSEIKDLLNNKLFQLKILLFSESVQVLDKYNIRLQDQSLSIAGLKKNIHECYNSILDFVIKPELWEKENAEFLKLDFEDWDTQDRIFMSVQDFIKNISDLNKEFKLLELETKDIQKMFVDDFFDYFGKILNSLKQYLPLENELVNDLDFVELKDTYVILKQKMKRLCDKFNLFQNEEEKVVFKNELLQLKNLKAEYYRETSQNTLNMWDRIEKMEKWTLIPKLVRIAESLPTSSATIEQSFSNIKLLKNDLRNRLSELSLEGLILVGQEFRNKQKIPINEKIIQLYQKCKENQSKKVENKKIIKEIQIISQKDQISFEEVSSKKSPESRPEFLATDQETTEDVLNPVKKKVKEV